MPVYDFAPDLDLREEEGSIFVVKGIGVSDGIVYAKVVICVAVNACYKDKSLLWGSDSCVDGDWDCRTEQAAIEGE